MRLEDTGIGVNEKAKGVDKRNKYRVTGYSVYKLLLKTHYSFELHFK